MRFESYPLYAFDKIRIRNHAAHFGSAYHDLPGLFLRSIPISFIEAMH
jgi:hypothetical protein